MLILDNSQLAEYYALHNFAYENKAAIAEVDDHLRKEQNISPNFKQLVSKIESFTQMHHGSLTTAL